MKLQDVKVVRKDIRIAPDPSRVLIRPFIPSDEKRVTRIISRAMALPEEAVKRQLDSVVDEFAQRHLDLNNILLRHYNLVCHYNITDLEPSLDRKKFIGALFTNEYALECAALFNPSIVPHPDQSGLSKGSKRFIISLRATGEGHISSITFRMGVIDNEGKITIEHPTRFVVSPYTTEISSFDKGIFKQKIFEMGLLNGLSEAILEQLENTFTLDQLTKSTDKIYQKHLQRTQTDQITRDGLLWLAKSNYEIKFSPDQKLSQRIIFPIGPSEQNGIEDARFLQFTNDDGSQTYYATYTAYDGKTILPQLIETRDFLHFKIITLNGKAVQNKGMALFPRKVNGNYAMLSRQDNENLFLMYSDNIHFWYEMIPLLKPTFPWEFIQIGNCGSPIETEDGWLVLTHGVGPMRKYCIGAILLDLHNPRHVLGRLDEPLLIPNENEREGYVPNVVYTCGAMVHGNTLILPYAMSDYASSIATVDLSQLISLLKST